MRKAAIYTAFLLTAGFVADGDARALHLPFASAFLVGVGFGGLATALAAWASGQPPQ